MVLALPTMSAAETMGDYRYGTGVMGTPTRKAILHVRNEESDKKGKKGAQKSKHVPD